MRSWLTAGFFTGALRVRCSDALGAACVGRLAQGCSLPGAAPLSSWVVHGSATPGGPPAWHPAPAALRAQCAEAAAHCRARGSDLGKLALQFSAANPEIPTHIVGTADPKRVLQNLREMHEPIDHTLLAEVQAILAPVHNLTWPSGRPENN